MGLGQLRIKPQCLLASGQCLGTPLLGPIEVVVPLQEQEVGVGQPGVGLGEARVELDGGAKQVAR
ncbi:MAG TPA: hypothetical protein VFG53_07290 [Anaeromyxobacter sp.]|nr:hypothetical protein [Anaeromyxobacter sp.]